jgi:hypothetical protein
MLEQVTGTFTVCTQCLDGAGGECHAPGCIFWINRAPDIPIRRTLAEVHGCRINEVGLDFWRVLLLLVFVDRAGL